MRNTSNGLFFARCIPESKNRPWLFSALCIAFLWSNLYERKICNQKVSQWTQSQQQRNAVCCKINYIVIIGVKKRGVPWDLGGPLSLSYLNSFTFFCGCGLDLCIQFYGEKKRTFLQKDIATHFISLMIIPTVSSYSDILMNILESHILFPLDCVEYRMQLFVSASSFCVNLLWKQYLDWL